MGQYHKIVNLTKRQFISPRDFNEGVKLMEFGNGSAGTLFALSRLLLNDWKGDRIAIVGDYGEPGDIPAEKMEGIDPGEHTVYSVAMDEDKELKRYQDSEMLQREGWDFKRNFYTYGTDKLDEVAYQTAKTFKDASRRARQLCWRTGLLERTQTAWGEDWTIIWDKLSESDDKDPVVHNMDDNTYISTRGFGDSGHFTEGFLFGRDGGVTTALAVLLASACKGGGRGGGDIRSESDLVGSWAGSRLQIVDRSELDENATDISEQVRQVLTDANEGEYHVFYDDGRVIRKVWALQNDNMVNVWNDELEYPLW